ncbi:hypothetical protein HY256_03925 [Candidatus Sumerlaeota bacterium]|nr:hypothetical protein [Candidatus Sumerlaeota bacterium]
MAQPESKIIEDFRKYVTNCGGRFDDWSVGVCENPVVGLFVDRKVDKEKDHWIAAFASTSDAAQNITRYLGEKFGAHVDAATKPGQRARGVYAYRRSIGLRGGADPSDTARLSLMSH